MINTKPSLCLYDKENTLIGEIKILEIQQPWYIGKIKFINCPNSLRQLFSKYEAHVNSQLFSLLAPLEEEIEKQELRINNYNIFDVQIMNGDNISFKSNRPFGIEKS